MQAWLKDDVKPFVFHMCWTASKVDKIKYLKQLGGWFMPNTCDTQSTRISEFHTQKEHYSCFMIYFSQEIPRFWIENRERQKMLTNDAHF